MKGSESGREQFVRWGCESMLRVSAETLGADRGVRGRLGEMIGDADIVALSEGAHGANEPLDFRNQLFRYLVEEKAFTAIAIESGLVEGRGVHDYVRGRGGEPASVLAQGISWTFDRLPQNRDLAEWLKDYNLDPQHTRKINFYGFDVPGSPGNGEVKRGADTALLEVIRYLERVDPEASTHYHGRLDAYLPDIQLDCLRRREGPRYTRLDSVQRDVLTATIADLLALLERREAAYSEVSGLENYEWARRAAIGARQIDAWLRQVPPGWEPTADPPEYSMAEIDFFNEAHAVRDRAQVDNLEWIVEREGEHGKVLIFGSRFHLSTAPFYVASHPHPAACTYLRRRWGGRLLTIGNLIGHGASGEGPIARAAPETIDGVGAEFAAPAFLLDLRGAPAPVAHWLEQEHPLGAGQETCRLAVAEAFDALWYIDAVTPA